MAGRTAGIPERRPTAAGDCGETAGSRELREGMIATVPHLRAFARFLVRDASMADDLVQETVVRALAAAHQFRPGTLVKAWLFTILRNIFYEHGRRRRREQAALQDQFLSRPPEAPEVSMADLSELQAMLWKLPPLQREALVLVGAQGLTHDEAALICGVPVGTMRARVSRARAALALQHAGMPSAIK